MKSKKSLIYIIFSISVVSLFSKVLGFVREGFTAAYFGTSAEADVFFLAFSIYTLMTLVIGSSIGVSYLPVFVKTINTKNITSGLKLTSVLLNHSFLFSVFLTLTVFLFAEDLSSILAPTYDINKQNILSRYLEIMSLSIMFSIAVQILLSVVNGLKKYLFANMIDMMYSLVSILLLFFFHESLGVKSLVYSVIITAIIQFVLLFYNIFCVNNKLNYVFSLYEDKEIIKRIYLLAFPVIIGTGTLYVSQAIDKIIASMLVEGSVSALNYSGMIHSIINSLLITSVITVFYTEMSNSFNEDSSKGVISSWSKGVVILFFIICPISMIFFMTSDDIVKVLLMRGAFDENSVYITAMSLSYYVLGSPFFAIRNLTTRVFYIFEDAKTPMVNGVFSVVLNAILSYLFSINYGVKGITLATSISAIISMILLIYSLNLKFKIYSLMKNKVIELLRIIIASIFILIVLYFLLKVTIFISPLVRLILSFSVSLLLYVFMLYILKSHIIFLVISKVKNKINMK